MSKSLTERMDAYYLAMSLAKNMLNKGIISKEDYAKIDTIMLKKYGLNSCIICL